MTSALLNKDPAADGMGQFLRDIGQYPRLTAQEEQELARRCAAGDREAVRTMVNANLRLVVSVAREYAGRGVPMLDLIQEGSIGLLKAAQKYDYTRDTRFSTYATKWIHQGIGRYLLYHGGLIRVPAHTAERIRRVLQARTQLYQQLGEEPTRAQIAEKCDMSEDRVDQLLELLPETVSLDAPLGSEEAVSLALLLEDIHAPEPQEELVRRELKSAMGSLLETLEPRQRQILELRFGMVDGRCHSFSQIGALLEISGERARQIERQAMDKLQKAGAGLGLEDFLE